MGYGRIGGGACGKGNCGREGEAFSILLESEVDLGIQGLDIVLRDLWPYTRIEWTRDDPPDPHVHFRVHAQAI